MFVKLQPVVLFVSLLSLSCFVLNVTAIDKPLSAQETQPSVSEETPVQKGEKPVCNVNPGSAHKHGGCKEAVTCCHEKACGGKPGCGSRSHACYHGKQCGSRPGCDNPCYKRSECSESNRVDKMLDIARCAKKQLLKEKIKAKLETKIGAKLDKVADLLVDTMLEECEIDKESKELRSALKEKLSEIFSEKTNK